MFKITIVALVIPLLVICSCNNSQKASEVAHNQKSELIDEVHVPLILVSNFNSLKTFNFAGNEISKVFKAIEECEHSASKGGSPLPDLWVIESCIASSDGFIPVQTTYISLNQGVIDIEGDEKNIKIIEEWFYEFHKQGSFGEEPPKHELLKNEPPF